MAWASAAAVLTAISLAITAVLWQTIIEKVLDPRFGVTVFLGDVRLLKAYYVAVPFSWVGIAVASSAMWFGLWWARGYRIAMRCFCYSLCIASSMILPCVIW